MSFELIGLGKLLNAMYATTSQRVALLREDIRQEIKKANGYGSSSGGDFYGPFWADAKRHVAGELDLRLSTVARIESNANRRRLYPLLRDGFLLWWEDKRRRRNEPFTIIQEHVKGRYEVEGLGVVKIENTLAFRIGDDAHRVIYPYFCEDPSLAGEAARLGLWAMSQCLVGYGLEDMRVLDVILGNSFSIFDTPLNGSEEAIFHQRYRDIVMEWYALREEYA